MIRTWLVWRKVIWPYENSTTYLNLFVSFIKIFISQTYLFPKMCIDFRNLFVNCHTELVLMVWYCLAPVSEKIGNMNVLFPVLSCKVKYMIFNFIQICRTKRLRSFVTKLPAFLLFLLCHVSCAFMYYKSKCPSFVQLVEFKGSS